MNYLNVLDHLKAFSVDRIIISDFSEEWETTDTENIETTTDHATVHDNSLEITGMAENSCVYTARVVEETDPKKVFRLDDRETVLLHLYSDANVSEESLSLILSDSANLTTSIVTLDIPALVADTVNIIEVEIAKADRVKLSNIKTVGIKALSTITATLNLALLNATSSKYIITVEELEQKMSEGEDYVLSKLGPDYTEIPDDKELEGAVSLASAGYAWMKQKENEQYQFDYGNQTTTQNYGVSLLRRAKMIVNSYLAGGDTEDSDSGGSNEINTDLIGYSTI